MRVMRTGMWAASSFCAKMSSACAASSGPAASTRSRSKAFWSKFDITLIREQAQTYAKPSWNLLGTGSGSSSSRSRRSAWTWKMSCLTSILLVVIMLGRRSGQLAPPKRSRWSAPEREVRKLWAPMTFGCVVSSECPFTVHLSLDSTRLSTLDNFMLRFALSALLPLYFPFPIH